VVSMMRVISSDPIVESANHVVRLIADSYISPNKTLGELHQMMDSDSIETSEICWFGAPFNVHHLFLKPLLAGISEKDEWPLDGWAAHPRCSTPPLFRT